MIDKKNLKRLWAYPLVGSAVFTVLGFLSYIYIAFTGILGIGIFLDREPVYPEPEVAACGPFDCYPVVDYLLGSLIFTGILIAVTVVGYLLFTAIELVSDDCDHLK